MVEVAAAVEEAAVEVALAVAVEPGVAVAAGRLRRMIRKRRWRWKA